MKALFKVEAIGYSSWKKSRSLPNILAAGQKKRWWVAKITGYDGRYGYKREFLRGQVEYAESNSKGSRGVFLYFFLEPGLYEVNAPASWKSDDRFFARSAHGKVERISKAELKREIGFRSFLRV